MVLHIAYQYNFYNTKTNYKTYKQIFISIYSSSIVVVFCYTIIATKHRRFLTAWRFGTMPISLDYDYKHYFIIYLINKKVETGNLVETKE